MRQINTQSRKIAILSFLLLLANLRAGGVAGQEMGDYGIDSIELHLEITSLRSAAPPTVVDEKVLFTYRPATRGITGPRYTRYVGVAFEHENYDTVHVFARNNNGVFFFLYPIPTDVRELRYRYVVDGLWLADPENPNRFQDVAGIAVSYVAVPAPAPDRGDLPRVGPDGRVEFVYRGPPNAVISIAGSFSNWDPYMHRMSETNPGEYETRLRLPAGTHTYYFVVNGRRELDPLNPDTAYDVDGNPASRFTVPAAVAVGP